MTELKVCDICGDEVTENYVEVDVYVYPFHIGEHTSLLDAESPIHYCRECFNDHVYIPLDDRRLGNDESV